MYTLPLDYSRVGFLPLESCEQEGWVSSLWLVSDEVADGEGGDYLPRCRTVGMGLTPPMQAQLIMK